ACQSVFLHLWVCPPVPRRAVNFAGGHAAEFEYAVSNLLHDAGHSKNLIVPLCYLTPRPSVPRQARIGPTAITANCPLNVTRCCGSVGASASVLSGRGNTRGEWLLTSHGVRPQFLR